jgi:hypothetical protein
VQRKQAHSREGELSSIRQEAYSEGYAAAMQAVVEFSTSGTAKSKGTSANATSRKPAAAGAAPRRQRRGGARRPARRAYRGDNALHIAEAMIILPDRAGRAAAIKKALAEKGYQMSYPSIRHGLGQLRARCEASVACQQRCRRRCSSARFRFNGEPATEPL